MYYSCTTFINTLLVLKIPETDIIFSSHYQKGYVKSGMAGRAYLPCHLCLLIQNLSSPIQGFLRFHMQVPSYTE